MGNATDPDRYALRDRIRERSQLFGTFVQMPNPTSIEVLGRAGVDLTIIDLEHGEITRDALPALVRAADGVGLPLLARLPIERLSDVSQILDVGCTGVLFARVGSVKEARRAVEASRYPPSGDRGACPGTRANDHGWLDWQAHTARAEARTVVGIAVEGQDGIGALDEILALPGVDFVFVGVFDLSSSLGIPGQLDDPSVVDAVRSVADGAARAGKGASTWAPTMALGSRWLEAGVTLLTVSIDVLLWRERCLALVEEWQTASRAAV